MKDLLDLFLSYMKLALISMFLAAICFSLYAGYKSRNESFLQATIGGLAALLALYIVMVFLSLKPSDLWRNVQKLTTRRTIPKSPQMPLAPSVNWPVSNLLVRSIVAVLVLVSNGVFLITFAKSRAWPIKIAVWSFSALAALLLAVVCWTVLAKKREMRGYKTAPPSTLIP